MLIHTNNAPYSPNTLNKGAPMQANQAKGKGFFTAPQREVNGKLSRTLRASYSKDYWSQPRQFYNSLLPEEQQFLVNAIRFETSQLKSPIVKQNVVLQLNKIHNGLASKVAETLGMPAPKADSKYYHDKTFQDVSTFATPLKKIVGLKVGVLTTTRHIDTGTINSLKASFKPEGVSVTVVGETLAPGIDQTYSATDAIQFDALVIAKGTSPLFASSIKSMSPNVPAGRPLQILMDSYRYGKPVAFAGDAGIVQRLHAIPAGPGVYNEGHSVGGARVNITSILGKRQGADLAAQLKSGLRTFRFLDRFPVEK